MTRALLHIFSLSVIFAAVALGAIPEGRHADPVVLKGVDVDELIGQDPSRVVVFRFGEESAMWEQVPVQIDEMHMKDWLTIKQGDCYLIGREDSLGHVYADAETYSGPDEDATFDDDDELVFMARHLGDAKPNGFMNPPGTENGFEVELEIQDPTMGLTTVGYLYIFLSDGSLNPDANNPLVQYELNLLNTNAQGSNSYLDAYQFNCTDGTDGYECHENVPVNPEDSWFRSQHYERHFSENWYSDDLRILTGGANGENFLNTQDFQFTMGNCERCQESFVRGRTAFTINKAGPVRALRSWVGANSGTITERQLHMYEQREDQVTYLRVHTLPGLFDYLVYKSGTPLTYYNCYNMGGFAVDGVNDANEEGYDDTLCHWEMMTGPSGTYLRTIDIHHNVNENDDEFEFSHWYYDNATPTCDNCGSQGSPVYPNDWNLCSSVMNGIPEAWGTHGIKTRLAALWVPNSDPNRMGFDFNLPEGACQIESPQIRLVHLNMTYTQYFLGPDTDPMVGEMYHLNAVTPLVRNNA